MNTQKKNNYTHQFNRETKMAGKHWVRDFMKRHADRISLRQPTSTSIARAMGFNRPQVNRFYEQLETLQEKYKFEPCNIYNMDESGFTTVPNKAPKVLSTKGKRCVNKISSAERGINVTVVCAMSASGNYVPPAFIFPRKRMKAELLDGAPANSIGLVTESGRMNSDLFLDWLNHFKYHVKPTESCPILLILDNYLAHTSLAAVNFCRQNNIHVLTLPPHSTHKMQPLDRCFFSPLKKYYANECEKWMLNHPARPITIYQVATLFNSAYMRTANISNAVEGFKVGGISPFNRDLFTDADFLASIVTERPVENSNVLVDVQDGADISRQGLSCDIAVPEHVACLSSADTHLIEDVALNIYIPDEFSSSPTDLLPPKEPLLNDMLLDEEVRGRTPDNTSLLDEETHRHFITEPDRISRIITSTPENSDIAREPSLNPSPSILTDCTHSLNIEKKSNLPTVRFADISPLPKASVLRKPSQRSKKSEIITSSPYKKKLEDDEEKTKKKNSKPKPTQKKSKKTYGKPKNPPKNKKKIWKCPGCGENYREPITEDWIQCIDCTEWWHDDCTSYAGIGEYKCDLFSKWSTEVELDMQGTVNLGKEVVEALSQFIEMKKQNGRRALEPREHHSYTMSDIVKAAHLCRDLDFCKGGLDVIVNKYVTMLAEGIESIFKGLVNDINKGSDESSNKVVIFDEELKGMIKDLQKLIRTANADIKDNEAAYIWINLIKKISAKFLDRAISFAAQRLEGKAEELLIVKKNLTQKIVIVVSLIELKIESTLCAQHDICSKSYECTKALNTVLESLNTCSEENLKEFIKYFTETLSGTNFYERLRDVTAHEFQNILHDMSETDNALTKNIISVVRKSVEERQNAILLKYKLDDSGLGRDVKLVHIILSDMDFIYSKQKDEPFHDFFGDFYDWTKEGGRMGAPLRRLMRDIQNKMSFAPKDLFMKLIEEVKVFMEIAVDPVP